MDSSFIDSIKRSTISHLCLAIIFFTSGLIINFIQLILYYTVRIYSKRLFRKINWYLTYSVYSQLVCLGEWWSGSKVIIYVDREDFQKYFGKEHGYLIMNHTYEIDWLLGWIILERLQILGNAKAYCKKAIQYMPVLGWAWKFAEFVFLERNFEKDRKNIDRQVAELCDYPDPMWLLLYPEGTRFNEEKHKASLEFARKHNQPELKYHLLPRTKGFAASIPAMRGKVPAIYDCLTVFTEDEPVDPTMKNLLMGKSVTAHLYFRRIPLEEVPESEEGMDKYLKNLFVIKDKMKEGFLKHGDFFKYTENLPRYEPLITKRRYYTLLNTVGWSIVVLIPMISYLFKLLFSGELVYLSIAVGIIGIFYFLLQNLLSMSDIKKSSTYGINTKKSN
ncbi:1-acyl-sn-glycerol-3-phosphate acyltransferase gamma-like [Coccinella septempunctata]|uniref:1-acyl-sn-glycerol-3-phosphate acyltransferase gamma-like n=1 Tax=Coccinella septempunctata TaxID=41139 RepID=UPI001D06D9AE|nr:1-acyl-sn-glycerol-3-phosphate acyltransferase gamma-like [Coccinella septempunctata]